MGDVIEPDAAKVEATAKLVIRQGIADTFIEGIGQGLNADITFDKAVAAKILELVRDGYQPAPMPQLGIPTPMPHGALCFMARNDVIRRRAQNALASRTVEDWVYFDGNEDKTIRGRVIEATPSHAFLMFTVKPEGAP